MNAFSCLSLCALLTFTQTFTRTTQAQVIKIPSTAHGKMVAADKIRLQCTNKNEAKLQKSKAASTCRSLMQLTQELQFMSVEEIEKMVTGNISRFQPRYAVRDKDHPFKADQTEKRRFLARFGINASYHQADIDVTIFQQCLRELLEVMQEPAYSRANAASKACERLDSLKSSLSEGKTRQPIIHIDNPKPDTIRNLRESYRYFLNRQLDFMSDQTPTHSEEFHERGRAYLHMAILEIENRIDRSSHRDFH